MYARTRVRRFPLRVYVAYKPIFHYIRRNNFIVNLNKKMRKKNLLAAMLLIVAGLQTAWAQGFRVYQSDGTQLQFSLSTDSIVFDNGLSGDEVFGPFTPVNQCIAKTWYMSKTESFTFNADGTTDYMEGATYKFFPYQGNLVFYSASGVPMNILRVYEVTAERMIVTTLNGSSIMIWSATVPPQYVTSIVLSETSLTLDVNVIKPLTATVLPEDADNKELEWTSSDSGIAWVNQNGLVIGNAVGTCAITCSATDGSGVYAECQVTVTSGTTPDPGGHEWVDLGLPSGTLWATCNVGASNPEEYGDYFAWGETEPKSNYTWSTYLWCNGSANSITKYCQQSSYGYNGFTDTLTELLPEDDAATANWGSVWKMPSIYQVEELFNSEYTTTAWTNQNNVNGCRITGKNGKSIFLPAVGFRYDASLKNAGSYGDYWSCLLTFYSYGAEQLCISSDNINWGASDRYFGRCVRPVRKK